MATLTQWMRSMGGSGALANAARACRDREESEAALEQRLQALVITTRQTRSPRAA